MSIRSEREFFNEDSTDSVVEEDYDLDPVERWQRLYSLLRRSHLRGEARHEGAGSEVIDMIL